MSTISINDTFHSIDDLAFNLKEFVNTLPTKYNPPLSTPKLFTITCIGKKDFQCDSLFQAILRKKRQSLGN
ncbi:hypothetical protein GVAV_001002 [Gurleya vavrai]